MDDFGQSSNSQRLREPGHAFQQDMPASQQPDQQTLDHGVLSHDPLGHFLQDPLNRQQFSWLGAELRGTQVE